MSKFFESLLRRNRNGKSNTSSNLDGYQRKTLKPPWCKEEPHDCNCGVKTIFENGAEAASAPSSPSPAPSADAATDIAPTTRSLPSLAPPPEFYETASPEAVNFWLQLVVKVGMTGAYVIAHDAMRHGFDLQGLYAWCAAHGLT